MRGRFAGLVFLALIFSAPAIAVDAVAPTAEQPSQPQNRIEAGQTSQQRASNENKGEQAELQAEQKDIKKGFWCGFTNDDFICWTRMSKRFFVGVTTSDTLPQWVVSACAFCSLFISIWGIWIVRGTLRESRHATEVAIENIKTERELGIAQIRAYLNATHPIINGTADGGLQFGVRVQNSGQSPAETLAWSFEVRVQRPDGIAGDILLEGNYPKKKPIGANASENLMPIYIRNIEKLSSLIKNSAENTVLIAEITIRYKDVFNSTHEEIGFFPITARFQGDQLRIEAHGN